MDPVVPASMVPAGPLTATGTLFSPMFSMTRLPDVAGLEPVAQAVRMATGVLVKVLSISVTEPTFKALEPPAEMSIPTPQLLMDSP